MASKKLKSRKVLKLVVSVILAGVTTLAVNGLRMLPYSSLRVQVTDAMTIPGAILAEIYAATFGETKHWLVTWAWLAMIGNIIFYFLFWFALISVHGLLSKRSETRAGGDR